MTSSRNASERPASQETTQQDVDELTGIGLGDERALASLYDRHSTLVYSVALRVCHDSAVAEEVLQNIFMQIWLAPHQFASSPDALDATLGLLSRNLAVDLKRRRKSTTELARPAPISHTEVSLLIHKPHSLVLLLPDADRRILDMAFFDDKAPQEIARETNLPLDTVTARLGNAMAALRSASSNAEVSEDDGLEVLDLDSHSEFTSRNLHTRDLATQMEGLRRLTHSFVADPDNILQELVNAAVDLCGADSAGISLETEHKSDDNYWHWVATAGQYNGFLHATLPRYPSACGVCLERSKPQLFRVRQRFFDIMGINAPLVTDGILLPWQVDETRGTIFIMAHGRTAAFDKDDGQLMRVLADFAAMAVRHQRQQHALLQQAKAAAAAEVANKLAHRINNPLQSLMNVAHLAAEGQSESDTKKLGQQLSTELRQISALVAESLAPTAENSRKH